MLPSRLRGGKQVNMKKYLGNAFSLQMLQGFPANVKISECSRSEIFDGYAICEDGGRVWGSDAVDMQNYVVDEVDELRPGIVSVIGHADTAAVLGVPFNRTNVSLEKGDVLYVAQLQGGRLPEGSTTLPIDFTFKYLKVEVL